MDIFFAKVFCLRRPQGFKCSGTPKHCSRKPVIAGSLEKMRYPTWEKRITEGQNFDIENKTIHEHMKNAVRQITTAFAGF